ncbi:MAG: hypothetical protein COS92_03830 [Desulfobacterales bacterium CG07_land_8_20_14_0_80_52_14]|nr:MAG: hypothetical protein COX20_07475 [Desulfobacterales bacterium CG23_combo_of_CG06-09_8_20_14_all_52_9]PIU49972.1 MAG: hypothetical protein COS92_03830 [Desulfobacterales bacterium CG07_land_8_20_14_0_80_52_14]
MTQVIIPFHGRPYRFDVPDRNLADGWLQGGLILGIAPLSLTGPTEIPDRVVRGFAEVTEALIRQSAPRNPFYNS